MKPREKPTHAYVGRCRGCGAVLALCTDIPGNHKMTAELVSDNIKDGLLMSCVPWGEQPPFEDCCCVRTRQEAMPL